MPGARTQLAAPRRWRAHHVLLLALAGACTQSLDLDGYTFQPGSGGAGGTTQLVDNLAGSSGNDGLGGSDTGAGAGGDIGFEPDGGIGGDDPDASTGNDGGASGSTGAAGSSGSAGASGGSGAGGVGNGGAGGLGSAGAGGGGSGSGGASGSAGGGGSAGTGGGGSCTSGNVCVPAFPFGWVGPIAVSRGGGSSGCPTGYATEQGDMYANLQPGVITCGCDSCEVDAASFECHLQMSDGNLFVPGSWDGLDPGEECESPPLQDELLTLVPIATCSARTTESRTVSTWGTTERTCGGAVTTGTCAGGSCYPGAGSFGGVCIAQDGDHNCPSGFGSRSVFYTNFTDTRVCSACSCELQGDQACEMNIEVCDLGGQQLTLHTYAQTQVQLNSSDGDGVTIQNWSAVDVGNCDAYAGTPQGAATPTGPVTVCCL